MTEPTDYISDVFRLARFVTLTNGVYEESGNCEAFATATFVRGIGVIKLKGSV